MTARRLLSMIGFTCITSSVATAQTFISITPTQCPTSSAGLFTTGGQYTNPNGSLNPNNGVLLNSWSMLMRWQGNLVNPVAYDPSAYTELMTSLPHTSYQRGYQPEDAVAVTPVTQLQGCDAGMILNSWYAPHDTVVGGGWNDMYGYAWAPAWQPFAFQTLGMLGQWKPAELVLQASLAVPDFVSYIVNPNGSWTIPANITDGGSGQLDLFAYIADASHPSLPPIALLAAAYSQGWVSCDNVTPTFNPHYGTLGRDFAGGVWFTASGICNTDTQTVRYTAGLTTSSTSSNMQFYRVHITPQNLTNLITRINSHQCSPGKSNSCDCQATNDCPPTGYSTDPASYRLQYTGVIAETSLRDANGNTGTSIPNRQVGMSTRIQNVGAFHYTNP